MKNDPNEHANQLSLDFDSPLVRACKASITANPKTLTLAYSAPQMEFTRKDISQRESIISETLRFARQLSW